MNKGLFITFEGNDGSGKTTISKNIYEKLKKMGYPVIYTREPGGIDIAEQIRNVILNPKILPWMQDVKLCFMQQADVNI